MGFPLCLSPPTPKEAVLWFQIFLLICNGKEHWTELWRRKIKILDSGSQKVILRKIKDFFLLLIVFLIKKWDKSLWREEKIEICLFRKHWNQIIQRNKNYAFSILCLQVLTKVGWIYMHMVHFWWILTCHGTTHCWKLFGLLQKKLWYTSNGNAWLFSSEKSKIIQIILKARII